MVPSERDGIDKAGGFAGDAFGCVRLRVGRDHEDGFQAGASGPRRDFVGIVDARVRNEDAGAAGGFEVGEEFFHAVLEEQVVIDQQADGDGFVGGDAP